MKKTVLIIIGLLLTFISISQETEITLHDKGGYVSQTGKLVEGYKQGQWININRRGDTSFALYKKDQIIFEKTFVKQTYGEEKGSTIVESKYFDYNKLIKSLFILKTIGNEIHGFEKNVTCPSYSKPYYKYKISDYKGAKSIIQQFDFKMLLYQVKDFYGTQYDNDLRHVLPYYGRVEFITDETGNKKISNVIVNFGSLRIGDKKEGEEKSEEDNYEIEVSDSYFFLEESFIQVKKNNQVMARQTFFKGLPTSYVSYYDNENINISYSCVDGVPDGEYQSYHENGKLRVSCFFKNGALNGEFRKYDLEGKTKYLVPFVDGEIEGVTFGLNQAIYFSDRKIVQTIKVNDEDEVIRWTSGYNKFESNKKTSEYKIDKVNYTLSNKTKEYQGFSYGIGDYHFRWGDYPTQDMVIINLNKGKDNWFALYVTKDNKIKDDINVTVDGVNYREKSKQEKLKLINDNFMNLSYLRYRDFVTVSEKRVGDTLIRSTYFVNGVKCLEEKLVNGKFTGTRKVWSFEGDLLQVTNYLDNHSEGLYLNLSPTGKILEKGEYVASVKVGTWSKYENGILYEYDYDDNGKAIVIRSYFESGKIKSTYEEKDSIKISKEYNEDGSLYKLNIRNFKNKLHGEYFTTFKDKTYKGYYLNGYKHGALIAYNEKGKIESIKNFEYGRLIEKPTRTERQATCGCPQEFDVINGSSFFPGMKDVFSYAEFNLYFKDLLAISEYDYQRLYIRRFQNSYSRSNVTKWYGFDMINQSPKKAFKLVPYKGVDLLITPCVKTGETGYRTVSLNTTRKIEAYSYYFNTEEEFKMTSENVYKLLLKIANLYPEKIIKSFFNDKESLDEIVSYLNKKGMNIPQDTELEGQRLHFSKYLIDNNKEDEFYDLFFKKEFNHGYLDVSKNKKGYDKFNQSLRKYFRPSTNIFSIADLEKKMLTAEGNLELGGGTYGIKHPLLSYGEKETTLYFSCQSVEVSKQIIVRSVSDICIQSGTEIKGTNLTIESVTGIQFTANKLVMTCKGKAEGVKNSIAYKLEIDEKGMAVVMNTQQFSEKELNRMKRTNKGKLDESGRELSFIVKD
jgi:antitoxin component YwqK of YwqJK toxin-antitoxin module